MENQVIMKKEKYSTIILQTVDVQKSWRRCGDSANYIASYMANEFQNPDRALNIIGVILNELLEYFFEASEMDSSIIIDLSLDQDSYPYFVSNKIAFKI